TICATLPTASHGRPVATPAGQVPDTNATYLRPPASQPFTLSVARAAGEVEAPPSVGIRRRHVLRLPRSPKLWPSMATPRVRPSAYAQSLPRTRSGDERSLSKCHLCLIRM